MEKYSVIIVEDYEVILEGYLNLISSSLDYEVVGAFTSYEKSTGCIKRTLPDLILIDIGLPGISGIEAIGRIKCISPDSKVIVVSVHENSEHVFDALCNGAIGYLTKRSNPDEILNAMDQALKGGAPMSMNIAKMVVDSFKTTGFEQLTKKENLVLASLANGKSYSGISDEMDLSLNTIKFHIRNIYSKLQVKNRDDAVDLYNKKTNKRSNRE